MLGFQDLKSDLNSMFIFLKNRYFAVLMNLEAKIQFYHGDKNVENLILRTFCEIVFFLILSP